MPASLRGGGLWPGNEETPPWIGWSLSGEGMTRGGAYQKTA
jgi:hypothetical protein